MLQNTEAFWKENWERHYQEYISRLPFQAYYLYCFLRKTDREVLEIAAGSSNDTVCLNEWGISCTGIDFCQHVIQLAKEKDPKLRHKFLVMDAKRMTFPDKSFDVSFHNGFLVNFQSDAEIHRLLAEQARVTKRLIVCSVHNQFNLDLIHKFKALSQVDDLYNIRFYKPDHLKNLLKPFCRKVKIFPFQCPGFDRLIALTRSKDFVKENYIQYHHTMDINQCKRLMAVGYL